MEVRTCQNCGAPLSETAKFCNRCGSKMVVASDTPTVVQQEAQDIPKTMQAPPAYNYGQEAVEVGQPVLGEAMGVADRKHGGCLSAFLALALIANLVFGAITLVTVFDSNDMVPLFLVSAALNFAGAGFAVAVWRWKKWGVYGYVAVIGVTILINLGTGNLVAAAQGILPILILVGLVRSVWGQMD